MAGQAGVCGASHCRQDHHSDERSRKPWVAIHDLPLCLVLLTTAYCSSSPARIFITDCVELPHTTLEPHTTLNPFGEPAPQTTDSPETTGWPLIVELENSDEPHTTDWPPAAELPHTTGVLETNLALRLQGSLGQARVWAVILADSIVCLM